MSSLQNPKLLHMDKLLKSHSSLMNNVLESQERWHKTIDRLEILVNGESKSIMELLDFLKIDLNPDRYEAKMEDLEDLLQSNFKKPDWTLRNKGKQSSCVTVQGSGPLNDLLNRKIKEEQEQLWRNVTLVQVIQLLLTMEQKKSLLRAFELQFTREELPAGYDPEGILSSLGERSKKFFQSQADKKIYKEFTEKVLSTLPVHLRAVEKPQEQAGQVKTPKEMKKKYPKDSSSTLKQPTPTSKPPSNKPPPPKKPSPSTLTERGRPKKPETKPRSSNRSKPPVTRKKSQQQKN
jgi:hypothetical protein